MTAKISPSLEERLKSVASDEPLEVIVQLEPPQIPFEGSRAERIDATRTTFNRIMADLTSRLSSTGGKVLDGAWINSTARILATPDQIKTLADDKDVQSIDSPVGLQPD
ncbi:hypothetical protein SBI67_18040 [Mycolicibacterium sp. 120266]|jgi:hypothetical protein|uniref:hypothetical protein n=1 Tax=Mycolicibacterium sp. 120266 TaxID=3090601 RepID=UPI00299F3A52|nr:hypothetical protein [Mycolicibacterium sp. 120266]MDX1874025.1 hypothetical protein [Mycolicibacterium sp. 120266]